MSNNIDELKGQLKEILLNLRNAVDLSVNIRQKTSEDAKAVTKTWEDFLRDFFSYILEKGKETGQNLMADISFQKIWRR